MLPLAKVAVIKVANVDGWGAAFERGVDDGMDEAGAHVREAAVVALATRTDPWGQAFAPITPTTLKLYATIGDDPSSLATSFDLKRDSKRSFKIRTRGKARAYAAIQQFGNPHNYLFNNSEPSPIPPRPPLPMRIGGVVDLPPEMRERVLSMIRGAIQGALISEGAAETARASRAIRRGR
jgi:hypothetical protein